MQVSESNPMVGIEGRTSLLRNLSNALKANPTFFGSDARPGNMLGMCNASFSGRFLVISWLVNHSSDFLELQSIPDDTTSRVHISTLWKVLIEGLAPIWPAARTTLGGVPLGDVWPCAALRPASAAPGDDLVPFHKLTGWITYSLVEPIEKVLGWRFEGREHMTGLPEYRNGGRFLDVV